jgi:hypothetical protein
LSLEEFENQDGIPEVEPETQQEETHRRVEIDPDELKDLRETIRRQQEELHQQKLWAMQQYQQNQKPEPEPQVDPDVERVLAPVIQKNLRPVLEENERLKGQVMGLAEQARVQANIDFIERNIPNFEDIRQDLAKEIEALPKADQDVVLNSPTLIVKLAQSLNASRGVSSKQVSRQRAVTESSTATSATKNSSALGSVDWNSLTPAEFAAQEAKIEQMRRSRSY